MRPALDHFHPCAGCGTPVPCEVDRVSDEDADCAVDRQEEMPLCHTCATIIVQRLTFGSG